MLLANQVQTCRCEQLKEYRQIPVANLAVHPLQRGGENRIDREQVRPLQDDMGEQLMQAFPDAGSVICHRHG